MAIIFENKGIIDTRAIKIMGVSVKESANPIGFFGTGLKYAIAILLRNDCELSLYAGGTFYKFEKKDIEIRSKEFQIITMNDVELPFTTELGKKWEMWQAFRELVCNTQDENGKCYRDENFKIDDFDKESTYFIVNGAKFEEAYQKRDDVILNLSERLINFKSDWAVAYNVSGKFLFYKGVRVKTLDKQSMYTWNIYKNLDLTEDRTLAYANQHLGVIANEVASSKDKKFIESILVCDNDYIEADLSFDFLDYTSFATEEFFSVLQRLYDQNDDRLNLSAREMHVKINNKKSLKNFSRCKLTAVEEKQLERAIDVCKRVFPDIENYEIVTTADLGKQTMALANIETKQIVLSRKCFQFGTKYVVSTLIEEYKHLETGYGDLTREFQTHLFDTMTSMIENHVINEPI